jgi:tetraacyldisaccharide 4'-kinase
VGIVIKQFFIKWIEQYLFFPNPFQKLISIAVLPFTVLYCVIVAYKKAKSTAVDFGIDIISVGNIVLGGSGKTPVTIALARDKKNVAIILRGYGRKSKGMFVVSNKGKIIEDINTSGDEARLFANSLPNATVIVCENRVEGILKAKELGSKLIYLDDGYSQHHIKKFDILVRPKDEPTNIFCLPSGGYRETKMMYAFAPVVLKDGTDFSRIITFKQNKKTLDKLPSKIVLVTAISKASRLFEYLPSDIKIEIFIDHYNFTQEDMNNIQNKYIGYTLIVTAKDLVKLEQFNIKDIILMDLEVIVHKEINYTFR